MTELIPIEAIVSKILYLRGEKVLLDRDLAELYGVQTRVLNQAVSRNAKRFPDDFMFELTREEIRRISQIVISSKIKFSKRVRVFTEQGVAMLSTVLNSERAIEVNIAIMRAFVYMREGISAQKEIEKKLIELEDLLEKHDDDIKLIFEAIRQLMEQPSEKSKKIGFTAREKQAKYGMKTSKMPIFLLPVLHVLLVLSEVEGSEAWCAL